MNLQDESEPFYSAQLGNALRETCGRLLSEYETLAKKIIDPFRTEMIRLIQASDSDIVNRQVKLARPETLY